MSESATATAAPPSATTPSAVSFSVPNWNPGDLWTLVVFLFVIILLLLLFIFGGLQFFGMTFADVLNFVADTITDLGIQGLKIFDNSVHDVTRFVLPVSTQDYQLKNHNRGDDTSKSNTPPPPPPESNQSIPATAPTQINQVQPSQVPLATASPTVANAANWCYVGQSNGKRSCVPVPDASKCLSGQVFPTLDNCFVPKAAAVAAPVAAVH